MKRILLGLRPGECVTYVAVQHISMLTMINLHSDVKIANDHCCFVFNLKMFICLCSEKQFSFSANTGYCTCTNVLEISRLIELELFELTDSADLNASGANLGHD